jgi:alanine dehydrogenase
MAGNYIKIALMFLRLKIQSAWYVHVMKIGVRREDKNEWERRVPLTPDHVRSAVEQGLQVVVQPSTIRIFNDDEYRQAGAVVQEDLSECPVVFAVKEIPGDLFRRAGAYMFFSHSFKGQPYNMPMLRKLIKCGGTLIDYEKVTDEQNRRLIFFGNYAGTAGMFETLYTFGKRLQWEGIANPLAALKRPVEYSGLEEAKAALKAAGERIASEGVAAGLSPVVVGFSGYGNVSRGAQEIFALLPHENIHAAELDAFMKSGAASNRKLYKVVFYEKDMAKPRNPAAAFDLQHYYREPDKYESRFEGYLPHLSILVNCIYWDARYPRLVTKQWVRRAWSGSQTPRLRVIGDISCDIEGSVECTVRSTEPGDPIYTYLPSDGRLASGWEGHGPVIMAVDTLPSELPREASASFGDMLMPFVPAIARANFDDPFDKLDLPQAVKRAVIVHRGEFTPDYLYMSKFVQSTSV